MLGDKELDRCLDEAVQCALMGGTMIKECVVKQGDLGKDAEAKSCATDLVTEYDQKVEKAIMERLTAEFPDFSTLGEESSEGKKLGDEPTWVVDPIDGTLSFMHKLPDCCVCIGLSIGKKAVLGVVYAPLSDELFTAVKGRGAFCNGVRIKAAGVESLKQSLVCSHFPSYSRDPKFIDNLFSIWRGLMAVPVQGMRAYGSCAVDMCHVAKGRLNVYFEVGIWPWDVCAAAVILEEAGGVLLDITGGPFDMENRRLLACSTPKLAEEMVEHLKKTDLAVCNL